MSAQVCRISTAGLNRNRLVLGDVNTECPAPLHSAPFGNWGVTSNFGAARDSHQFDGWCHDTRVCDNNGNCTTDCRDGWYEWNSCTGHAQYRAPNCTLYNDQNCMTQKTSTGVNVHGTRDVDVPVSCPVGDEGGCRDVRVFTNGSNFMSLYELDPLTGNQLVQTLIFPPAPVFLNCLTMSCPAAGSDWVLPSGFDSPVSPVRASAEMAAVVNFGTFLDPGAVCRTVSIILRSTSAASYQGTDVAAGSLVSGFGPGLAAATAPAASLPLPTELGGVSVRIRDAAGITHAAPLLLVSPSQVNYLIPAGAAAGQAIVSLIQAGQARATGAIQVVPVSPGVFTANADGRGVPAAIAVRANPDGTQQFPPVFQCGATLGSCLPVDLDVRQPAYLSLFGTGIRNGATVAAAVGGVPASVEYAGPQSQYPGLDQVNLLLPASLAGRGLVDVVLTVDGKAANAVTIRIR